jgi:hypothetical protein
MASGYKPLAMQFIIIKRRFSYPAVEGWQEVS